MRIINFILLHKHDLIPPLQIRHWRQKNTVEFETQQHSLMPAGLPTLDKLNHNVSRKVW